MRHFRPGHPPGHRRKCRSGRTPTSSGGIIRRAGTSLCWTKKLVENAGRVGEEAVALLSAPQCPSFDATTVILDSSQVALQIHESCGHPIELDRVLGTEAAFAGTSFLTPDKLGRFRYGSEVVNITADATISGGLGTFGFDDEGVEAQKTDIVKNGSLSVTSPPRDGPSVGLWDPRMGPCARTVGTACRSSA